MKKYEITENFKKVNGKIVYQIKSLKDFGDVRCGDLGGWIESENNLSQADGAWVYGAAVVMGQAVVYGKVFDEAQVYGNAVVFEPVYANSKICK